MESLSLKSCDSSSGVLLRRWRRVRTEQSDGDRDPAMGKQQKAPPDAGL